MLMSASLVFALPCLSCVPNFSTIVALARFKPRPSIPDVVTFAFCWSVEWLNRTAIKKAIADRIETRNTAHTTVWYPRVKLHAGSGNRHDSLHGVRKKGKHAIDRFTSALLGHACVSRQVRLVRHNGVSSRACHQCKLVSLTGGLMPSAEASTESPQSIARDIALISRIGAVPSMLKMICDETGMGFSAVARVTDLSWTACAVQDNIGFGLKPGEQLELHSTLCCESRVARTPIIIDDFSLDATYRDHHTSKIYKLRSYISVPIITPGGSYFGNLCAIDPSPARVSEPRVVRMFEVFATLIAMQIDSEQRQSSTEAQLTTERETGTLREQFIAVLGHDLRNPLSAVNATAEYLVRRTDDTSLVNAGNRLKRTVSRMARLIDDVMDFARGRLGSGMAVSIQPVDDLDERLRAVVEELRLANPSRDIVTDFALTGHVDCDPSRMQQLLSNLLGNALTHGAADEPVVVRAATDDNHICISVANRGEPIPSEVLLKVFEPYWRPPSSSPGGGLGLGLFICKEIVEAHGGTIVVCSSAGDGTCFTARLPVLKCGGGRTTIPS